MTGFPGSKDGTLIDFMLGFGEDFDGGVAPVGVGAKGIGHDDGLSFGGELGEFVKSDAFGEERRIEGDGEVGVALIGTTMGFKQELGEKVIVTGKVVRVVRGTEAKSFGNGSWEKGRVIAGRMNGSDEREGLRCETGRVVEKRKLVGVLIIDEFFFFGGVKGWQEVGGESFEGDSRVDGFEGRRGMKNG